MVTTTHRLGATHGATARPAVPRSEAAGDGIATGIRVAGAEAGAETGTGIGLETGIAETGRDGGGSGFPYPTQDQVEQSLAIQRLQWLRHLPAPRTPAEHGIYQRIRAAGWTAPA